MLLGLAHFDAFRTWFRTFSSTPSVIPSMGSVLIQLVAPTFRSADAGLKASATPKLGHYPSMISFDKADEIFYITASDMIISIRVGTIRERDGECCTCPCTSRTHVPIAGGIS